MTTIFFPVRVRLGNGLNDRKHWRARARANKAEKEAVFHAIWEHAPPRPKPPCVVTLTRVAPSNGLDDDNLPAAFKAVRDQLASWIGVDDRHSDIVRYVYAQRRGPWGVEVSIQPMQESNP